jgi:hypothetical protein
MLKKSASGVLAWFRSSTYSLGDKPVLAGLGWVGKNVTPRPQTPPAHHRVARLTAALPGTNRVLARRGWTDKKVAILSIM